MLLCYSLLSSRRQYRDRTNHILPVAPALHKCSTFSVLQVTLSLQLYTGPVLLSAACLLVCERSSSHVLLLFV
jgi:hypothetical protein